MRQLLHAFLFALAILSPCAERLSASTTGNLSASHSLRRLNLDTQPKIVKIFGVGGLRQLEAYQTGLFISAEGHILTTQSLVLDDGEVTVVLWNGARATGTVTAVDPVMELALVKIDVDVPVEFFRLDETVTVKPGTRVLALANLFGIAVYDEPVSVLQGVVTNIVPLAARRGAFQANYSGKVYVLDAATNNPGAAGGAVVDLSGQLIGLIGKELRSESTGTWLNYALPVSSLHKPVERMLAGEPAPPANVTNSNEQVLTLENYGIVLVPDVVERTPPFVERVVTGSSAADAGVRPDDLIVAVEERTIASLRDLMTGVAQSSLDKPLRMTLLRDRELVRILLEQPGNPPPNDE